MTPWVVSMVCVLAFVAFAAFLVVTGHPVFAVFAFFVAYDCVPTSKDEDAR